MTCAVFFNLDDTLTELTRGYEEMFEDAVEAAGLDELAGEYEVYKKKFFSYFRDGRVYPRRQAMEDVAKANDCYDAEKIERFAAAWEEAESSSLKLRGGVKEALKTVAEDHELGIITNGTGRLQRMKLDELGIDDLFDSVVISTEHGVRKPEPAIFAIAKDSIDADTYVMVSHLPKRDIVAARKAEFRAIWLSSTEKEVPEDFATKISSFSELPDAVGETCS